MAEIYRDSIGLGVQFPLPGVNLEEAWIDRMGVITNTVVNNTPDPAQILVPYAISRYDGKFDVCARYTIEGNEYVKRDTHEIVTPLFTVDELKAYDPDFKRLRDPEIIDLERIIRTLFEVITGQSFGLSYGTVLFRGSGSEMIGLTKRALDVRPYQHSNSLSAYGWTNITNDGWVLRASPRNSWIDKFEGENAVANRTRFRKDRTYSLTGLWGYHSVPEDVKTAAMLLAQDYGCDQALWRDRWIKSIRAADWRIEFDSRAYTFTGNVKVDQILDKYAMARMVVL